MTLAPPRRTIAAQEGRIQEVMVIPRSHNRGNSLALAVVPWDWSTILAVATLVGISLLILLVASNDKGVDSEAKENADDEAAALLVALGIMALVIIVVVSAALASQ